MPSEGQQYDGNKMGNDSWENPLEKKKKNITETNFDNDTMFFCYNI